MKDSLTSVVATAAIVSPTWLDKLSGWSELLLPILGGLWLLVQIAHKVQEIRNGRKRTREEKNR